jgi:Rab GDP dissociation inhibitor
MDDTYDYVVLGTGVKECILVGLLSMIARKKVLHMDRNEYYGGESASLSMEQLYKKFYPNETKIPEKLGRSRDYCVDLCPKFIMGSGDLVNILLATHVTRYLDFRKIEGSYVLKNGKPYKVPCTPKEALGSSLLGFFQKNRFRQFITWVNKYEESDPKTHEKCNLRTQTMQEIYEYWKLAKETQQFVGHAIALEPDDGYRNRPAIETVNKLQLYASSLARFGTSPYIYPRWGLGGLPEGFARLCAVYGGTYMMGKQVDEIVYGSDGKVTGVRSGEETAACSAVIADPSYYKNTDKVKRKGQIARVIVVMDHPIPNTKDKDSVQIIIPAQEVKRQSNIYICMTSGEHKIAPMGKYVAVCNCIVEGEEVDEGDLSAAKLVAMRELRPALHLLGVDAEAIFAWVSDYYEPTNDGLDTLEFITKSMDATTHFGDVTTEVVDMYSRIMGEQLVVADLDTSDPAMEETN